MSNHVYGYVRVSTREQNTDRQVHAMRNFGLDDANVFIEKQSGKDFNRPQYAEMLSALRQGDTVVVKSIDRLGRDYHEVTEQWRYLTKEKGVSVVVLDMPLLDTRQERDLAGTLIADIVLQLLSYVAQTERDFLRQRQREGIAAAKARGVRFGAKPRERPAALAECVQAWEQGRLSARAAAARLGISHMTFLRWAREDSNNCN